MRRLEATGVRSGVQKREGTIAHSIGPFVVIRAQVSSRCSGTCEFVVADVFVAVIHVGSDCVSRQRPATRAPGLWPFNLESGLIAAEPVSGLPPRVCPESVRGLLSLWSLFLKIWPLFIGPLSAPVS